jgi:hypothetical protein
LSISCSSFSSLVLVSHRGIHSLPSPQLQVLGDVPNHWGHVVANTGGTGYPWPEGSSWQRWPQEQAEVAFRRSLWGAERTPRGHSVQSHHFHQKETWTQKKAGTCQSKAISDCKGVPSPAHSIHYIFLVTLPTEVSMIQAFMTPQVGRGGGIVTVPLSTESVWWPGIGGIPRCLDL